MDGRVLIKLVLFLNNIIYNGYFKNNRRSDGTSDKYNKLVLTTKLILSNLLHVIYIVK